jgi:D-alanine-D-alanine ligase
VDRERRGFLFAVKIAVVQGGPSSEAEVSRASAAGVTGALEEAGHEVVRLELEPAIAEKIRAGSFDVVFPVVHGAVGEDGALQGLLEVLGAVYVGSDVLASAMAMNKAIARLVFASAGLPIARGVAVTPGDALECAKRARKEAGAAVVVKPAASGSAIGVSRFEATASDDDVARGIESAWKLDRTAIIESFVKGREITCSVLDAGSPRVLAATEIASPMDAFYTYEARYAPGRSRHTCPAELGALEKRVHEVAIAAHVALGCRDLSRADFIVTEKDVVLLEVNTLPGMTATSLYPEAAVASGLPFSVLCDTLVKNARARGATARNAPMALPQ